MIIIGIYDEHNVNAVLIKEGMITAQIDLLL